MMGPQHTVPTGHTVPSSNRPGRRRLGIDGHRQLVGTIAGELESSLAELLASVHRVAGVGDAAVDIDRQAKDINRLLNVLLTFDGPPSRRRPSAVSLAAVIAEAAEGLDLSVEIAGRSGGVRFVADPSAVRTGLELVLLALGDPDPDQAEPVRVRIVNDELAIIDGSLDTADDRRSWQLRYGRRMLESEGCQLRSSVTPDRYRLELRLAR